MPILIPICWVAAAAAGGLLIGRVDEKKTVLEAGETIGAALIGKRLGL